MQDFYIKFGGEGDLCYFCEETLKLYSYAFYAAKE